eukprot:TRINITY_DN7257_c0_g1_i3.p1 TRINITY_DN7257_c0_g1~~TRINITY_DN7257_c0_g1_i3.p1  ORF type:complete len:331 (+),score=86.16 TRINITY_DN7257_c0_g1_i3:39-995(+)
MNRVRTLTEHFGKLGENNVVMTDEVRNALQNGKGVVALESTIISHGMPYPQNVHTAKKVEQVVREGGAVPATIAILNGVIHVGLTDDNLELLGKTGLAVMKCSRRDMAYCVASKSHGATTVSGTMLVASMVGIDIFVTGGIGGVHKGVTDTMDISADLEELGRTRVAVVCAGVKSILDIPRTLEYLETKGVPVMTIEEKEFPAFFTRHSGCQSQLTGSVLNASELIKSQISLGIQTGVIIANPIPVATEASVSVINTATAKALQEAAEQGVSGKDATPFLLDRINRISDGKSLEANIALVLNNAKVGAELACRVARRS